MSPPPPNSPDRIGETLLRDGLISSSQLQQALQMQEQRGGRLGEVLIGSGALSEDQFLRGAAGHLGLDYMELDRVATVNPESGVLAVVPQAMAWQHTLVPLRLESVRGGGKLLVLLAPEPPPEDVTSHLLRLTGATTTRVVLGCREGIEAALVRAYQVAPLVLDQVADGQTERSAQLAHGAAAFLQPPSGDLVDGVAEGGGESGEELEEREECEECGRPVAEKQMICPDCGAPTGTPDLEQLPRRRIGNYTLESTLGEGGMGTVFSGREPSSGARVAVKVLHIHFGSDQRTVKRFHKEINTLRRLDHPGIVRLLDSGFEEGVGFYLVMELIRGRPLSDVLRPGAVLPKGRILSIFGQICDCLHHAHEKGIVHRDLKPDNVMLVRSAGSAEEERVKLLDFGIARAAFGEDETKLTRTGMTLGTPLYMSPEQAGGAEVDLRSDLYSLGAMVYQALVGHPVFEGSSPYQIMLRHIYSEPPELLEGDAPLLYSHELGAFLRDCLAKRPSRRPGGAREFKRTLAAALEAPPADSALTGRETTMGLPPSEAPQPAGITMGLGELSRSGPFQDVGKLVPQPSPEEPSTRELAPSKESLDFLPVEDGDFTPNEGDSGDFLALEASPDESSAGLFPELPAEPPQELPAESGTFPELDPGRSAELLAPSALGGGVGESSSGSLTLTPSGLFDEAGTFDERSEDIRGPGSSGSSASGDSWSHSSPSLPYASQSISDPALAALSGSWQHESDLELESLEHFVPLPPRVREPQVDGSGGPGASGAPKKSKREAQGVDRYRRELKDIFTDTKLAVPLGVVLVLVVAAVVGLFLMLKDRPDRGAPAPDEMLVTPPRPKPPPPRVRPGKPAVRWVRKIRWKWVWDKRRRKYRPVRTVYRVKVPVRRRSRR